MGLYERTPWEDQVGSAIQDEAQQAADSCQGADFRVEQSLRNALSRAHDLKKYDPGYAQNILSKAGFH